MNEQRLPPFGFSRDDPEFVPAASSTPSRIAPVVSALIVAAAVCVAVFYLHTQAVTDLVHRCAVGAGG